MLSTYDARTHARTVLAAAAGCKSCPNLSAAGADQHLNMQVLLAQGAINAFTCNQDDILGKAKNFCE